MSKKKEKNKKKKEKEAAGEDEGREEKVPPMSDHSDTEHKTEPLSADGSLRPERADSGKLRVAASMSHLAHDLSPSCTLHSGFLKQKNPQTGAECSPARRSLGMHSQGLTQTPAPVQ